MSKGIDIPINRLVSLFTSKLWVGNDNVFRGRIQRTVRNEGVFPEYFEPTTKEYKDVLLNDNVDSTVFFDPQSEEEYNAGQYTATVWICFSVNLRKLYPTVSERATEYAHDAAMKVIRKSSFKPTGLVRGLDAFSEYELVKQTDNMSQNYLFRIEAEVKYPQNCN